MREGFSFVCLVTLIICGSCQKPEIIDPIIAGVDISLISARYIENPSSWELVMPCTTPIIITVVENKYDTSWCPDKLKQFYYCTLYEGEVFEETEVQFVIYPDGNEKVFLKRIKLKK